MPFPLALAARRTLFALLCLGLVALLLGLAWRAMAPGGIDGAAWPGPTWLNARTRIVSRP